MIEEEIDSKLKLVKQAMLSSNNILLVSAEIRDHYKSRDNEISNNVVSATSKASDQPAPIRRLI